MSDSILGAVADAGKDIVKETAKQVATGAISSAKTAAQQVSGFDTPEEAEKKKADQIATFQRIKQLEAEITQISQKNEQRNSPEVVSSENGMQSDVSSPRKTKNLDEASRQAVGRAEQGRNFKG
jgi:hypothetical protein